MEQAILPGWPHCFDTSVHTGRPVWAITTPVAVGRIYLRATSPLLNPSLAGPRIPWAPRDPLPNRWPSSPRYGPAPGTASPQPPSDVAPWRAGNRLLQRRLGHRGVPGRRRLPLRCPGMDGRHVGLRPQQVPRYEKETGAFSRPAPSISLSVPTSGLTRVARGRGADQACAIQREPVGICGRYQHDGGGLQAARAGAGAPQPLPCRPAPPLRMPLRVRAPPGIRAAADNDALGLNRAHRDTKSFCNIWPRGIFFSFWSFITPMKTVWDDFNLWGALYWLAQENDR